MLFEILNQYSLFLAVGMMLIILLIARLRRGWQRRDWLAAGAVLLVLAVLWLAFKPEQTAAAGVDEIRSQIGSGTPVLLEFQSPY